MNIQNSQSIRWGILGAGRNSGKFASDFPLIPGCELYGIASRQLSKAQQFAQEYRISHSYGSYKELISHPEIDIIYIGTVNNTHYELTRESLLAGKSVLCEKPFTLHAEQTRELIELARSKKLFLLCGIWSRFFPVIRQIAQGLQNGIYGTPLLAQMDFCFKGNNNPQGRLLNPALGGGALADVGIYPLSIAQFLLGEIIDFSASAILSPEKIDLRVIINARHKSGAISALSAAIDTFSSREASISTDNVRILIHCPFWKASSAIIHHYGESVGSSPEKERIETIDQPYPGKGFHFEIAHVNQCLRDGLIESPLLTHNEMLKIDLLLDQIRLKTGIVTP